MTCDQSKSVSWVERGLFELGELDRCPYACFRSTHYCDMLHDFCSHSKKLEECLCQLFFPVKLQSFS